MAKKRDEQQDQPQKAPEMEMPAAPAADPKVDFDAWWAVVSPRLPAHHHKEIIKADFRGRGLTSMETMKAYHDALVKYGVTLR